MEIKLLKDVQLVLSSIARNMNAKVTSSTLNHADTKTLETKLNNILTKKNNFQLNVFGLF